ncbi:MAG TPA: SRPBCC family protein [Acidobacteriota bacterium]|nr:SRPBCC family protein [Acidobacteriota bacterium]
MSFRIEDKFEVKAPIDRVWKFLIDPQQVVQCLPGVKLTEIQDDKNFLGAMTLKIGPVSMSFQGKVQITELDEAEHRVRMSGEGREGGGWMKGSMASKLTPTSDTDTEIKVNTEVDVAGRALQFGRSLIESIMKQQFQKFAESVRKTLETPQ